LSAACGEIHLPRKKKSLKAEQADSGGFTVKGSLWII
jgi:hypothetical protein